MAITPAALIEWREAVGGRRYIMCMGAAFVNTILFGAGILSESGYLATFAATVGSYLGARYLEAKNVGSV